MIVNQRSQGIIFIASLALKIEEMKGQITTCPHNAEGAKSAFGFTKGTSKKARSLLDFRSELLPLCSLPEISIQGLLFFARLFDQVSIWAVALFFVSKDELFLVLC